jgi:hypothetical protein
MGSRSLLHIGSIKAWEKESFARGHIESTLGERCCLPREFSLARSGNIYERITGKKEMHRPRALPAAMRKSLTPGSKGRVYPLEIRLLRLCPAGTNYVFLPSDAGVRTPDEWEFLLKKF